MNENNDGWPVYDSIGQCSAALGCSPHALKTLKRGGCGAFRGARIYSKDLVVWLLEQLTAGPDGKPAPLDPQQMRARVDLARAIKIEHQNSVDELELIPASTVEKIAAPLGQQLRSAVMDLPERLSARCNPESPKTAFVVLTEWRDEFLEVNHALFLRKWGFEPEPPYEAAPIPQPTPILSASTSTKIENQ